MHAEDHHRGLPAARPTIWRVASTPFSRGMATSITTTSGLCSIGKVHGFAPVGGFGHHFDIRLTLQQQAQSVAHHGVIVSQKNARMYPLQIPLDFRATSGSSTSICVPAPGREFTRNSPPR